MINLYSHMKKLIFALLVVLSIWTLRIYAAPASGPSGESAQWLFGTYFQNLVNNPCTGDTIAIGFKTNTPDYAKPDCISIANKLASFLGSYGTAQEGQAVIWFDSITGEPKFGVVWWGDSPIGSIMAFNLNVCPVWWVSADWSNGTVDLRWEFIRWWDNGRGIDTWRMLASVQTDMFKAHSHNQYAMINEYGGWSATVTDNYSLAWYTSNPTTRNKTTSEAWWMETRPRNVALLYCMKLSGSASSMSDPTTWTRVWNDVVQASPWNIGIGTSAPSEKLDVNGFMRMRSVNGEGGLIKLDGNNGLTSHLKNKNGTFHIVNSAWTKELFSVDQQWATTVNNNLTVSNGWTHSYIFMQDDESPNGRKSIYANSNVIWFLNGNSTNWLSYWDNNGNQTTAGNIIANGYMIWNVYYDDDTNYYINSNNWSIMNYINVQDIYVRNAGKYVSQMQSWGGWFCFWWVQHHNWDGRGEWYNIWKSTYNETGTYWPTYRGMWPADWYATIVRCIE